ncbi:MAG: glycosyltransferase family 2 protein [Pseudomonadota bacterium]
MTDPLEETIEAPALQTPVDRAQLTPRDAERPSLLSVVCPAYNEAEVLERFHARVTAVLKGLKQPFEIVYVNDGSSDATLALMLALRGRDPATTVVDLSRNFGKEIALTAGLDAAQGDAVVVIDADLQDPPEVVKEMIAGWAEGYDVVYARRRERQGETRLKRATAGLFYKLMSRLGSVRLPENTGDFRLMSRKAVEAVKRLREQHRFMKGLFAWIGFPAKEVLYDREPRAAGETKWNYWKLWTLALEGVTSFTVTPLKVSTYLGVVVSGFAFLFALFIVGKVVFYGESVQGYPSMMVTILMLGGVQLIVLGVMGEYLGRVFNETKDRPLYLVNAVHVAELQRAGVKDRRAAAEAFAARAAEEKSQVSRGSLSA